MFIHNCKQSSIVLRLCQVLIINMLKPLINWYRKTAGDARRGSALRMFLPSGKKF